MNFFWVQCSSVHILLAVWCKSSCECLKKVIYLHHYAMQQEVCCFSVPASICTAAEALNVLSSVYQVLHLWFSQHNQLLTNSLLTWFFCFIAQVILTHVFFPPSSLHCALVNLKILFKPTYLSSSLLLDKSTYSFSALKSAVTCRHRCDILNTL